MNIIKKHPLKEIGTGFIPEKFLPQGKDEYYIRKRQLGESISHRHLSAHEIEVLVKNANSADDWNSIYVTDHFDPKLVKNNQFHGLIRIGDLESLYLEFHDIPLPVGIYNSNIISSDLGSNVSINNVNLLSHYIIENEVILLNINELVTTNYAKFGNGIIKEGEDESIRIWVEIANENGGRRVLPFDGMTAGDAWLWSRYRDRTALLDKLKSLTQNSFDKKRGYYGRIGTGSVLKHCRILKDVYVGSNAYIKGSNKLKNLTINSCAESPTQIGEGVELVNGIIGYGCHIFYGVSAVRFVMDDHTNLKYGARLINSFLGNNSTISCCEVLNALIYPGHEQHHNSSFLCASTILGQSNMASGATIGSNHNSRGNDGEIFAGRGFWPGLSTSLKHNCRFASFNLLVKGAYPAEIDNPLPFSLVSNDESHNCLNIIPAYWFRYNMYALARNAWKYANRDKRLEKKHLIIFDYLAPDTVNEIFRAMEIIRTLVEETRDYQQQKIYATAHEFLCGENIPTLNADNIESGKRSVIILKPCEAYRVYRDMLLLFAVKTLVTSKIDARVILKTIHGCKKRSDWENVGGQLIRKTQVKKLLEGIEKDRVNSWEGIHDFYLREALEYPKDLVDHAFSTLKELFQLEKMEENENSLQGIFHRSLEINRNLDEKCYASRSKDYSNPFRNITYSSDIERDAVVGRLDDDSFIVKNREDTQALEDLIKEYL
ncbi:DUF4954 family protein [Oceanispirochaeta sp.]|jgi:hypothetical protein|uniref:DUF4954 family protein n=1 Tax=Oceanispirochaeta sp. TaxID=2035350 RepID=UPI002628C55B|nr:DUF4954 family protein [Oceanispirochaeta sp.]MDA3957436.1 DUF4954 family protein [Oceanispirochaeta sp.]